MPNEFDFIDNGYDEQPQQYLPLPPQVESYDPSGELDDGDLPFIPKAAPRKPITNASFVDVNDPNAYVNPRNNGSSAYQQNLNRERVKAEPNFNAAEERKSLLGGNLSKFNAIGETVERQADDGDTASFAINAALKALSQAVTALKEVDLWLPQEHQKYASALKTAGKPIVDALQPYIASVSKLR